MLCSYVDHTYSTEYLRQNNFHFFNVYVISFLCLSIICMSNCNLQFTFLVYTFYLQFFTIDFNYPVYFIICSVYMTYWKLILIAYKVRYC